MEQGIPTMCSVAVVDSKSHGLINNDDIWLRQSLLKKGNLEGNLPSKVFVAY